MTPSERRIFWKKHIDEWRSSGLSQKAYCAQHGLSPSSFGYWRKRIAGAGKLIPVPLAVARPAVSVNIHLPSGLRIEVPLANLAEALAVMERQTR